MGLALLAALMLAPSAQATYVPAVKYTPPKILFVDQLEMGTTEDVEIKKDGRDYVFTNPIGTSPHPQTEPGCDTNTEMNYHCPVAGITKIVAKLGALNDEAYIDLGSKADKVKQILLGGTGNDSLLGGPGPQTIKGQDGDDSLQGGPGPDVIDGGPGTADTCDGGPGRDTITHCEMSPSW
jgi:Ca2+-binding RTX toxin-like protein